MISVKQLWQKYKSVILYLFFGGCTTLINIAVYYVVSHIAHVTVVLSTVIAWVVAVIFAFFTNKVWVFESKSWTAKRFLYEFCTFFLARIATGVLDVGIMYFFAEKLKLNDVIVKIIANIVVIISNYVASKLIIFRKKKGKNDENGNDGDENEKQLD